jgi:amino acid transporter
MPTESRARLAAAVAALAAAIAAVGTILHWSNVDVGPVATPQIQRAIADHAEPAFLADWTGAVVLVSALVAALAALNAARALSRASAAVAVAAAGFALVGTILGATRIDNTAGDGRLDMLARFEGVESPAAAGRYLSAIGAAVALLAAALALVWARRAEP